VLSANVEAQDARLYGVDEGEVRSRSLFVDRRLVDDHVGTTCGIFVLTTVYVEGRWWLCESMVDRTQAPTCANTGGVATIWNRKPQAPSRGPRVHTTH
jgi:hypothetical protein